MKNNLDYLQQAYDLGKTSGNDPLDPNNTLENDQLKLRQMAEEIKGEK